MAMNARDSMTNGTSSSDTYTPLHGTNMKAEVARTMRTIFKRCIECPDTQPSCPKCKGNQICSLVPQTCDTCQHMTCIANPNPAPPSPSPNVGAIAGGVIGGIVVVAIVVFFVWRFWIKKRREQQDKEAEAWEEEDDDIAQQKVVHQFNAMHTDTVSTRTRGSLANSILSRASNIIQIAYIPGVMNRNGSGHNSLLSAAPVPPIPAATRGQPPKSPLSNEGDMLFFRPGDLRDSSYSATSSLQSGNRDTQYTRQSITPSLARSSMASYRDDATEVPMPAQTVVRAAPRMVSVKSFGSTSPSDSPGSKTPMSDLDHSQFAANTPAGKGKGVQIMMPSQSSDRPSTSSSSQSQGSQYVKAKQVTVGSKGRFPVRNLSDASSTTAASTLSRHAPNISSPLAEIDGSDEEDDEDGEEHARARRSLVNTSKEVSTPPTIQPMESPFFDASEHPPTAAQSARVNPYATMGKTIGTSLDDRPKRGGRGMGGLSDIIEEATKRASRIPSHEGLGGIRDVSPFSDKHATG